jgi:pimeloyl-ACP methyl ester carboxylesterase
MDTNDLLQRWSTLSLDEIEMEVLRGEDQESISRLIGADTVAEIRGLSFAPPVTGIREDVILLPGIMGSLLSSIRGVTSLLWINPLLFLHGNARYLSLNADGNQDECSEIECVPVGLEKMTYLKISLTLNRQTRLREFPYDWRMPIEHNAHVLNDRIERWAEGDPNRKFSLVAHSMGGLVSRAYLALHPENAEKRIRQLIMHGTPGFGAANAVDTLLNGNSMMGMVDKLNGQNDMRSVIYSLPSVYQLLPVPPDFFPSGRAYPANFDLYDAAAWGEPRIQQKYLDAAREFHRQLSQSDPQIRQVMIAGCHVETLVTAELDGQAGAARRLAGKVSEEGEDSGDGTVPLWSVRLPAVEIYYIQEAHRKLPGSGPVIRATLDLILDGACSLPRTLPARRAFPFGIAAPVPFDVQAEDLRVKIETGSASQADLDKLFFVS